MAVNDPAIDAYVESHTTETAEHLRRLAEETQASLECPQMLSGPVEGRFLQALVFATGARRILELGTYSGYSALSMAEVLPDDGKIITCELDPERAAFAQRHIDATPYRDKIEIRVGPALETVKSLSGPFDLVFIDADKQGYPDYVEATLPLLSDRGLMVLDNTLWSGRVVEGSDDTDDTTELFRSLNERLANDPRLVAVMLPVRDGVTLVRRA